MKKYIILFVSLLVINPIYANEEAAPLKKMIWPFEGLFGSFDRQSAQRGFQVYKEVCAACHSMHQLSYRNLKDLGFSDAEVKEIAKSYSVKNDTPNDQGEMYDRPGLPSDKFVKPFPNEEAARAANGGANPPDLSLIVKAREDGANYVYSLLTGYKEAPSDFKMTPTGHYNPYFPGAQLAMPPPLSDGQVQYSDGTHSSVDQMARDVVIFLQWAAEPEMEHRKSMGLKAMMFLVVFTIVFYIAKRRIWARIES